MAACAAWLKYCECDGLAQHNLSSSSYIGFKARISEVWLGVMVEGTQQLGAFRLRVDI